MNIRLIAPTTNEEIQLAEVSLQGAWYVGKVAFIKCCGSTLGLFHNLELFANSNIVSEAEKVSDAIDQLGFVVEGLFDTSTACKSIQIMNGDDVVFKI